MVAAGINSVYPDSLSIYKNWLLGNDFDNNRKPALAAVLLLTEAEHSVSPVLLRCYLGAEAGGPIPEEDGVLGELLAYYDQWKLKETATHLLCNGSSELRRLAAHYFHNKLKFNDNDDMAKALFRTGSPLPLVVLSFQNQARCCASLLERPSIPMCWRSWCLHRKVKSLILSGTLCTAG